MPTYHMIVTKSFDVEVTVDAPDEVTAHEVAEANVEANCSAWPNPMCEDGVKDERVTAYKILLDDIVSVIKS